MRKHRSEWSDPLVAFLDAELARSLPAEVIPAKREHLYRELLEDLRSRAKEASSPQEHAFLSQRASAIARLRQEELFAVAAAEPVASQESSLGGEQDFGVFLKRLRQRSEMTQSELAKQTGIDRAYIHRMEKPPGEPVIPSRSVVLSLARALGLSRPETDTLLVAAGYVPLAIVMAGGWRPEFELLSEVLLDPGLTEEERARFGQVLHLVVDIWRRQPA